MMTSRTHMAAVLASCLFVAGCALAPAIIGAELGSALRYATGIGEMRQARHAAQFESWPMVAAIATRRIEASKASREPSGPQDPQAGASDRYTDDDLEWHLLRANANRRMGRYAEAVDDYRIALSRSDPPEFDAAMGFAVSLMASGRWTEAQRLISGIAERDARRTEPLYNLALARAFAGDVAGARSASGRLRSLDAARADALDARYLNRLGADGAVAHGEESSEALAGLPMLSGDDLASMNAPGRLAGNEFRIGERRFELPRGDWTLASRRAYRAPATSPGGQSSFPALEWSAFKMKDGALHAIVHFASNAAGTPAMVFFDGAPCEAQSASIRERTDVPPAPAVCRFARWLDSPADSRDPRIREAHALAQRAGARVPTGWYELHVADYHLPTEFRDATVLWRATSIPGDSVAADWLPAIAFQVRVGQLVGPDR